MRLSMARANRIKSLSAAAGFAAMLALTAGAIPTQAADPAYPTGSRIGLVPPAGMVPSKTFPGFEDLDKKAAILVATLPASAYAELDKTIVPETLKKQGITVEKREPMHTSVGDGFLIVGKQESQKINFRKWILVTPADGTTALVSAEAPEDDTTYTDSVMRGALATLSQRAAVPDAERLSFLPFTVGNLAGFQIEEVLPGRAVMLKGPTQNGYDTRLLLAAMRGGPDETADHGAFARELFGAIGGVKDVRISMSEPLRMNGQQGYQTMAQAKDPRTDADVMLVQWLRFGSGGFLQMTGIASTDGWTDILARMRTIRDSVDSK